MPLVAAAGAPPSPATRCPRESSWTPRGTSTASCHVDADARTAVVEPGAVLDAITEAARKYGLRFGPDPSTHSRATIGGSIGNNACGSRALGYGRTADNVIDLHVLAGVGSAVHRPALRRRGSALTATRGGPEAALLREPARRGQRAAGGHQDGVRPVHPAGVRLLAGAPAAGERDGPGPVPGRDRGTPGADPAGDRPPGRGAEGHRADRARLRRHGRGRRRRCPASCRTAPVALEGLDSRLVEVVRTRRGPAAVPDLPRGGGWLFVETTGETAAEAADAASKLAGGGELPRQRGVYRPAGRGAMADPRGRRRAWRAHPGQRPRLAWLGGLGGPAGRPARLHPRTAGADGLRTGSTG